MNQPEVEDVYQVAQQKLAEATKAHHSGDATKYEALMREVEDMLEARMVELERELDQMSI